MSSYYTESDCDEYDEYDLENVDGVGMADQGMTAERRDLYRNGCDDAWQEWAPEDIGVSANSAPSSAKFALIVRRQRHQDADGEPTLALFSITVQSPLIKKQLASVFDGYSGINTNLRKVDFKSPFNEFFYRWKQFVQAIPPEGEETKDARSHYMLLFDIMSKEITPHIEQVSDLVKNNVISFQYVWALFEPDTEVYTKIDGHDRILIFGWGRYQENDSGIVYVLPCRYVDTDGKGFGFRNREILIQPFKNLKPILELNVVPCRLVPNIKAIREQLSEQGRKFEGLRGVHHRSYTGVYERAKPPSGHPKQQYVAEERIIIDATMFFKYIDERPVPLIPLIPLDANNAVIKEDLNTQIPEKNRRPRHVREWGVGPHVGPAFIDTVKSPPEVESLPEKYRHLCTHVVRGFCLKTKDWVYLDINSIQDIVWSNAAFDQLVLPHDYKRIIRAFVHAQMSGLDNFDDMIKGKGRGIIMLLSGEPGTGKTLTAESVAETMNKPLYGMSAGELGDQAGEVEKELNRVLELSTQWRAVLLIDECDVFLERRSSSDLERNKLVSIFLRLLEYYQGVMFLTTNRVSSFDPAFESRIHLTIPYPNLDVKSRLHIWKTFVKVETGGVSGDDLGEFAKEELNGRQIKNVVKTAGLLASEEGIPLCSNHINTVLRIKRGNIKMV